MPRYRFLAAAIVLLLAAEFPAPAQYPPGGYPPGGGYPGGGYPGGRYPDTGGVGFPMPGRNKKKKNSTNDKNTAPLENISGMLRQLDDKALVLEASDTRILNLARTANTKFFKDGKDLKPSDLKPGDHLNVDARQDEQGYYFAVNVNFQKEGTADERSHSSVPIELPPQATSNPDDDRPILRRKDSPAPDANAKPPRDAPTQPAATSTVASVNAPKAATQPPPAPQALPPIVNDEPELDKIHESSSKGPIDEDDPGAPKLKRGKSTAHKSAPPQQVAANTPPPSSGTAPRRDPAPEEKALQEPPRTEPVAYTAPVADPKIEKTRAAATDFTASLPSYICQEQMARFVNTEHVVNWRPLDVVSTEVVYENGREHYRNLAINGKPVQKKMEELSGAWSTGEFGSVLSDLFSQGTAAEFHRRGDSRSGGRVAFLYDFEVDHDHSHWHINVAAQSVLPAYRGSIWIDKESGRILRIEMQSRHMPEAFPMDKVELATDYEFVRIGEAQFLLPVHAETLSCERGTSNCSRNTIDFRNYHKYAGESTIQFDK